MTQELMLREVPATGCETDYCGPNCKDQRQKHGSTQLVDRNEARTLARGQRHPGNEVQEHKEAESGYNPRSVHSWYQIRELDTVSKTRAEITSRQETKRQVKGKLGCTWEGKHCRSGHR